MSERNEYMKEYMREYRAAKKTAAAGGAPGGETSSRQAYTTTEPGQEFTTEPGQGQGMTLGNWFGVGVVAVIIIGALVVGWKQATPEIKRDIEDGVYKVATELNNGINQPGDDSSYT